MTLIGRLQAATQGTDELSAEIARDVVGLKFHDWPHWIHGTGRMQGFPFLAPCPAYTTSLDDALTLVPNDQPWDVGWESTNPHGMAWVGATSLQVTASTPALALCIAALKARGD